MLQRIDDPSSLGRDALDGRARLRPGRVRLPPAGAVLRQTSNDASGVDATGAPQPSGIGDMLRALATSKLLIATTALLSILGALLFSAMARPQHHATTQILIDPRDLQLLDKEVNPRSVSTDSGIAVVESQVRVLASDSVMLRVVKDTKLAQDEEFNGLRRSLLSGLQIALARKLGLEEDKAVEDPALQALRTLKRQVFIRRAERSFVVDVTVQSEDPGKSVVIANAIAVAYLKEQANTRTDTVRAAGAAIGAGLEPMKQRVSQGEAKIARYKADKNLVLAGGRFDNEQQLTEVNNQLTLARAETARLKARVDEILAARGNTDAIPEAVRSESLRALRAQLGNVLREKARLSAQLQPSHPRMIDIANQERASQRLIDDELKRIIESTRLEFRRAQSGEQELLNRLTSLKTQMVTTNDALVELREMERDLEASRAVYSASLNRQREATEQEKLNTTNARVITAATPPRDKTWPPRKAILLPAALMAGLGLGGVLALARSAMRGGPPAPGLAAGRGLVRRQEFEPANDEEPRMQRADRADNSGASGAGNDAGRAARIRIVARAGARPASGDVAPEAATGDAVKQAPPHVFRRPAAETLRVPSLGLPSRAKLTDHIAAVEPSLGERPDSYRTSIDRILTRLAAGAEADRALITLVVGSAAGAGATSSSLSLAYRAATTGTRTLLIDGSSPDAKLSRQLGHALVQTRPCVLDSREHLAEITLQDERTGLALLPLALTDLAGLSPRQCQRLIAGLRQIVPDYELVLIDAGDVTSNPGAAIFTSLADHVLVVTRGAQSMVAAQTAAHFAGRGLRASVVRIDAALPPG
jgi:polysaccharide biosynthesis transport protein